MTIDLSGAEVATGSGAVLEFVFVDPSVPNFESLIAGVDPDAKVIILDPERSALEQIADAVSGHSNVGAIHIVSHGEDGRIEFTSGAIDSGNIGEHREALAAIGECLSADADILLYGCDIAASVEGEAFVKGIAAATGADVAASSDRTGPVELGGDWALEYTTGEIEADAPLSAEAVAKYQNDLALQTETFTGGKGAFTSSMLYFQDRLIANGASDASETISLTNSAKFKVQDFTLFRPNQSGGVDAVVVVGKNALGQVIFTQQYSTPKGVTQTISVDTVVTSLEIIPVTVTGLPPNQQQFVGQGSLLFDFDNLRYDLDVPQNSPPQVTGLIGSSIRAFNELGAVYPFSDPAVGINAVIQDADGDQVTVTVRADEGRARGLLVSAVDANGKFMTTLPDGTMTFTGTAAEASYLVQQLNFILTNVDDKVDTGQVYRTTFTITVDDGHGHVITNTQAQVDITGVNEAPTVTTTIANIADLQHQKTYDRDFISPFATIVIDDPDNKPVTVNDVPPDTLTVRVSFLDANGGLVGAGWTKEGVAAGVATWKFVGNYADATAAIQSVQFDPKDGTTAGQVVTTTFTIKVTDPAGLFDDFDSTVSVDAKTNTAPVLVGADIDRPTILEDANSAPIVVSNLVTGTHAMTDVDPDQRQGVAITGATGNWQYSTDGVTWKDFGAVSVASALVLSATTQIRLLGSNVNGEVAFEYAAWDRSSWLSNVGGTASSNTTAVHVDASLATTTNYSPFSSHSVGNNQTITAVNDAPIASGVAQVLAAVDEDSPNPAGETVSLLFAGRFSDEADNQTAFGGSSANVFAGIAVIGTQNSAQGEWQYLDGGTWVNIGSHTAADALLLSGGTKIRFLPAENFNGSPGALNAHLVDSSGAAIVSGSTVDISGAGSVGGTTRYSVGTVGLSTTINPVNDAPTIAAPSSVTVIEDVSGAVAGFSIADVDSGGGSVTVTLGVASGTLAATSGSGVTVGGSAGALTLTGSVAEIKTFIAASGVKFTTALNATDDVDLTVTVNDGGNTGSGGAKTTSTTVAISVTPVNDAPTVTAPASIAVVEDTATSVTGVSIVDVDVGSASVTATLTVANGTLAATSGSGVSVGGTASALTLTGSVADINAFMAASHVSYTPAQDAVSDVLLGISVNDNGNVGTGGPQAGSTSVTITINAVADIANDTATTNEDTPVHILVQANDTFEGTPAITGTTNGANGTVTVDNNGTVGDSTDDFVVYTANADFNGSDSFTYTVTSGGATETATVNVTINAVADISDDAVTVKEDSGTNALDLLANDSFENSGRAITAVGPATNGVVAINNNNTAGDPTDDFVTYTPNANYSGPDTFTYTVTSGGVAETGTVTVDVSEVNDAPVATDDTIPDIGEDSGANQITFAALTGNDSKGAANEGAQTLTVTNVLNPVGGTVQIVNGHVEFTPTANYNGPASFDYVITDDGTTNGAPDAKSDTGHVTFNVTEVNDAPDIIVPALPITSTNPALAVPVTGVSFTDLDGNGGNELAVFTAPAGVFQATSTASVTVTGSGTTSIQLLGSTTALTAFIAGGQLTVTPNAPIPQTVLVHLDDLGNTGTGGALTDNVTFQLVVDNPPTADATSGTGTEDQPARIAIALSGSDADSGSGDAIDSFSLTSLPVHGQLFDAASGGNLLTTADTIAALSNAATIYFQPDADWNSSLRNDGFTYKAFDGDAFGAPASAIITVTAVQDAGDDSVTVGEDSGIDNLNLLANDTFENAGRAITAVGAAAHGTAVIDNAGTPGLLTDDFVTYTPVANYSGPDNFTYTVTSGGVTETANVIVTVTAVDDAPQFVTLDDTPAYTEGGSRVILDDDATITDVDTTEPFTGATLTLSRQGGGNPDDSFDGSGNLTLVDSQVLLDEGGPNGPVSVGSYVNADGTLAITFNSDATGARVNAVLQQINYANGSDNPPASVIIGFSFDDGSPAPATGSITVAITSSNDEPDVENVTPTVLYGAGDGFLQLSPALTVTDPDNATLTGATVTITNVLAGDVLTANPGGAGISAVFAGNVLTLSGVATVAQYEQVLESVNYMSTAADPTVVGLPRVIQWQVSDGTAFSTLETTNVYFRPTIDLDQSGAGTGFTTTYTEGGLGVGIVDTDVLATNGTYGVRSATIVLTNSQTGDLLSVGGLPGGFTSSLDTSVGGQITLTLTGISNAATFQNALQQVTFSNTGTNPGATPRDITVTLSDSNAASQVAHTTINVTAINDAPSGADGTAIASEDIAYVLKAADFGFSDTDGNALAAVKISTLPGAGVLTDDGVAVTAGQFVSAADIAAGLLKFTPVHNANGTGYANFSFQVQDDGGTANGGFDLDATPNTLTVNVTPVNDAPTAVNFSHVHKPFAENTSTAKAIKVADITVTDVDGGANRLSLAGADKSLFRIIGGDLWLKAGAHLDFETNPLLTVTVRVDGVGVGRAIDASKSLAIKVTDVVETKIGTNGPDTLIGTAHGETLDGRGGNDRIYGLGGDDRIIGGLGVDVLRGGSGRDVFVFRSILDSAPGQSGLINNSSLGAIAGQGLRDIITDFTHGQDKINLSAIDGNLAAPGNQAFAWRGIGAFTQSSGQLIERLYDFVGTANDKTVIYGDINGDLKGDFQIELSGLKHLTAHDFVL